MVSSSLLRNAFIFSSAAGVSRRYWTNSYRYVFYIFISWSVQCCFSLHLLEAYEEHSLIAEVCDCFAIMISQTKLLRFFIAILRPFVFLFFCPK